jgi:hypothetical protein
MSGLARIVLLTTDADTNQDLRVDSSAVTAIEAHL